LGGCALARRRGTVAMGTVKGTRGGGGLCPYVGITW
jgi:hypothetical protein